MSIDGEIRTVRAVARQMRDPRPPGHRRLRTWAETLDLAASALERQIRAMRGEAMLPLSPALPPDEASPGTDTPDGGERAAQRRRQVELMRRPPKVGTARRKVLDAVAGVARDPQYAGLTDWELAEVTGLSPNTVRPRRGELVTGGWLLDSGSTRLHHGKAHRVWVLSDRAAGQIAG